MSITDFFQSLQEVDYSDIRSWPYVLKVFAAFLLGVALLLAIYFLFYLPKLESLQSAQNQEASLKQEFQSKQKLAINLPAYKEQMVEIKDRFENVLRQLPNQTEVPALLTDISQAGLEQGLEFKKFKPLATEQKNFYVRVPIEIEASGTYHQLASFISAIANFQRVVTMGDLSLERTRGKVNPEPGAEEAPLNFKANIYTYHYSDKEKLESGNHARSRVVR